MHDARWLLLIHQLPARPLYLRAKVKRRLDQAGAVPLKNSVYALPRSADRGQLAAIATEVMQGRGEAFVCAADFMGADGDARLVESFRRAGQNPTRAAVLNALNGLENWSIGLTKPLTFKGGNKYANNQLLFAEIRADASGNLEWQIVSDFVPDPFPGQDIKL